MSMVDMHFYEQMSDEELLTELQDQRCEFFGFLDEIESFPPFDEAEGLERCADVAKWSDLIVKIELLAEERGLKYD